MRSLVCAQCHVEYYFKGDGKRVTYPWHNGLKVEEAEAYYDTVGHVDWVHADSGANVLKAQHPEFELWSQGIHARSGVSCADCHMPYVREGAVKVSDHWLRSPLTNVSQACGTCHKQDEQALAFLHQRFLLLTTTMMPTTITASGRITAISALHALADPLGTVR